MVLGEKHGTNYLPYTFVNDGGNYEQKSITCNAQKLRR